MTILRAVLTLGVMLALAGVPAGATTYTFNVTDGLWNVATNWLPNNIPAWQDTAIIPSGKTCNIEERNENAKIIQVFGTLVIDGVYGLTLGDGDVATESTLDGEIQFTDGDLEDDNVPWIKINPGGVGVTIKTSSSATDGLITASDADSCQPAELRTC